MLKKSTLLSLIFTGFLFTPMVHADDCQGISGDWTGTAIAHDRQAKCTYQVLAKGSIDKTRVALSLKFDHPRPRFLCKAVNATYVGVCSNGRLAMGDWNGYLVGNIISLHKSNGLASISLTKQ